MAKAKPYYGASAAPAPSEFSGAAGPAPSESSGAAAPQIDHAKIIGSKIRKILKLIEPIIDGDHIPSQMHMVKIIKALGEHLSNIKQNISTLKENEILMNGARKLRELGIEIKHFKNLIGLEKVMGSFLAKLKDFVEKRETCYEGIEIPTDIDHPILEVQRRSLKEIKLEVVKAIVMAMHEIRGEAKAAGGDEDGLLSDLAFISNLFLKMAESDAIIIEQNLGSMPDVNLRAYFVPIPAPHETPTVDDAMAEEAIRIEQNLEFMLDVNLPIPVVPHETPIVDDAMVEEAMRIEQNLEFMLDVNLPMPVVPHETPIVDDAMVEEAIRIEQNLGSMLGAYFLPIPVPHEMPTVDDVYQIEDTLKFPTVTGTALDILSGAI